MVGWAKSSLCMFAEQSMLLISHGTSEPPRGVLPTDGAAEGGRESGVIYDDTAVIARTCRLFELLDLTFDCMIAAVGALPSDSSSDHDLSQMSYSVAMHMYPSLFDSLSLAVLSSTDDVAFAGFQLLAKICGFFPDEFLVCTMEWLCCTFSRTFGEGIETHTPPPLDRLAAATTYEMRMCVLARVGNAMELIMKGNPVMTHQKPLNPSLLRALLITLLELFSQLANESLACALTLATNSSRPGLHGLCDPSCMSMGLSYLLHPIAVVMECLSMSSSHSDYGPLDIPLLRTLWMHLSLLKFTDRLRWADAWGKRNLNVSYGSVKGVVNTLAQLTPPLVEFTGGGKAMGFLERELAYCPTAKVVMKCLPRSTVSTASEWIDLCTGCTMTQEVLSRPAAKKLSSSNIGALLYLSAVRYLESLRITAHLEARTLFIYLASEDILSSAWLEDSMCYLMRSYFFSLWETAIMAPRQNRISQHAVMSLFQFVVTRCIHASKVTRDMAQEYLARIHSCSPWVYWHIDSVFTLFECVEILSCLKLSESRVLSHPVCVDSTPWCVDIFPGSVPPMEFPGSNEAISSTAVTIFEMCYGWFVEASDRVPSNIHETLHEYILRCDHDDMHGTNGRYIEAGVSIANELCSQHCPTYHLSCPDEGDMFFAERAAASRSVAQKYSESSTGSTGAGATFSPPRALVYKARYVGEASGLVSQVLSSGQDSGEGFWCPEQLVESLLRPCYEFFDKELSPANSSNGGEDATTVVIFKSAALLRELCLLTDVDSRGRNRKAHCESLPHITLSRNLVKKHAIITTRYYSALLTANFSTAIVSTLVFVWRWLSSCSSVISFAIIENAMICFQFSAMARVGLFHGQCSSCRPGGSSSNIGSDELRKPVARDCRVSTVALLRCADTFAGALESPFLQATPSKGESSCPVDFKAHEEWIDFISECLTTHSDLSDVIFDAVGASLAFHEYFSMDSSSLVARFKLLALALRLLKDSLLWSNSSAIKNKRHIMRERTLHIALLWFVDPIPFPSMHPRRVVEEYSVLKQFCQLLCDDSCLWVVEYAHEVTFDIEDRGHSHPRPLYRRGAGANAALGHLRSLMNRDTKEPKLHRHHRHESASSRQFGINIPLEAAQRSQYDLHESGIVWLLRVLIYSHLDLLLATAPSTVITATHDSSQPSSLISPIEMKTFRAAYRALLRVPGRSYATAIEVAWAIHPSLALSIADRFSSRLFNTQHRPSSSAACTHAAVTVLLDYISISPSAVRTDHRAVSYFLLLCDGKLGVSVVFLCAYIWNDHLFA